MKIDIKKYVGRWYEIAKIPFYFEKDMENVTAEYSLNNDGTMKIINSGYVNGRLRKVIGTAKPTENDDLFKVSFLPNVFSDYKILGIDENYQFAVVGGQNENLLWILSRKPRIDSEKYYQLVSIARKNGYNVDKLIITK
jgi:apolipoprotein D and lipocalin family protein